MTVQPTNLQIEYRRHHHAGKRTHTLPKKRCDDPQTAPHEGGSSLASGPAIAAALVFGVVALVVISRNGGSLVVSETGLAITVTPPV